MRRKSNKVQPAKAHGARGSHLSRNAWHEAAIRYWVFLARVYPSSRTSRYTLVRTILCHVEGVTINSRPASLATVTRTLKRLRHSRTQWAAVYEKRKPGELLDFDITAQPSERDVSEMELLLSLTPQQRKLIANADEKIDAALREFESQWRKASQYPASLPPTKWILERIARAY